MPFVSTIPSGFNFFLEVMSFRCSHLTYHLNKLYLIRATYLPWHPTPAPPLSCLRPLLTGHRPTSAPTSRPTSRPTSAPHLSPTSAPASLRRPVVGCRPRVVLRCRGPGQVVKHGAISARRTAGPAARCCADSVCRVATEWRRPVAAAHRRDKASDPGPGGPCGMVWWCGVTEEGTTGAWGKGAPRGCVL